MSNTKPNALIINAECMRDLCGGFYEHKTLDKMFHRNTMLAYLIPESTLKAIEKTPEEFGVTPDTVRKLYRETLTEGFEALMEDERTTSCINDFINGKRNSSEFTKDEIAAICDVYYINTVPAAIECEAIKMMRSGIIR